MIDFSNLNQYRESNQLEVKKAAGGIPKSIWETYSAFANTSGGIILLGVIEKQDNSLETINLPNPEKMIKEFWNTVNNSTKISINLLSDKDVFIQKVNGDNIIVINVPRAERSYKPVYLDGNPLNCYRRNGEGDYKCTSEEYHSMVRDASYKSQDMLILEEMNTSVFNSESVSSYRRRMSFSRPGHVWTQLEDEDFLHRIGAIGIGRDGAKHPTAAGLLMFGNEYDIVREYNNYFLDYQEQYDPQNRWTDRIISSSGDWSGNVYDFYFRVYNKLQQDIKTPFHLDGITRIDDTPSHQALREALANCLVNADYYGRRGVVIIKSPDKITLSNPGNSRIELNTALCGGISDPRNATMLKMFNFIDIGERSGSGIPNIYKVWKEENRETPVITENYNPERFTLTLKLNFETKSITRNKNDDKKVTVKSDGKKVTVKSDGKKVTVKNESKISSSKSEYQKNIITNFLKENETGKISDFEKILGVKTTRVKQLIYELIDSNTVIAVGNNKSRIYQLNKIS